MRKKSIAVVDDHPFVRLGVRAALSERPELEIVLEASDGHDAWLQIKHRVPDAVVLDIDIPKIDGYELIKRIQGLNKSVKVLVLSMYTGPLPVQRALQAGADGYIYKSNDTGQVCLGCVAVLNGYQYFPHDSGSFERIVAGESQQGQALTDRELAIARHLVAGYTNKEIGNKLFISDKTVSAHKHNIYRKLQIDNLIQLADYVRHTDSYGIVTGRQFN